MSKVPDQVLLPFKERMADRLDFDVAGLSAIWARAWRAAIAACST
jgi:hypothetical protein